MKIRKPQSSQSNSQPSKYTQDHSQKTILFCCSELFVFNLFFLACLKGLGKLLPSWHDCWISWNIHGCARTAGCFRVKLQWFMFYRKNPPLVSVVLKYNTQEENLSDILWFRKVSCSKWSVLLRFMKGAYLWKNRQAVSHSFVFHHETQGGKTKFLVIYHGVIFSFKTFLCCLSTQSGLPRGHT